MYTKITKDEFISGLRGLKQIWRSMIINSKGDITADEFKERVKIVHPTPADPVLTVDNKPLVAWV